MRRSREQIRVEYMRLAKCWAHIRDFMIEKNPQDRDIMQDLPTKDEIIKQFDQKCGTASELLAGLQQGVNDFSFGLQEAAKDGDPDTVAFLSRYKTETGRSFFNDAGNPRKIAMKILKRGKIADDTEYYLLKEIICDLDQTVFSASETARANEMLGIFEFGDEK